MQYNYDLYGMRVRSDLAFPQFAPVSLQEKDGDSGGEEIRIRAMDTYEEARFLRDHGKIICGSALGAEKSWLCNRTLEMSVERGNRICYHIRERGDPGAARTYLAGFGMAMLALQQGKLPFHCSALAAPEGGAVLIAGESGAGKSTLTANLLGMGYRFLADDMAVVEISRGEGVWVYPAYPYMKLCRDAVARQGYASEGLRYIDEKKDKFLVPCAEQFQREKVRLERFVWLGIQSEEEKAGERSGTITVDRIAGPDSILVYKNNLFTRHLWKNQDPGMEIWQNCLRMAREIPVFGVKRPAAGDSTAEVAAEVHKLRSAVSA